MTTEKTPENRQDSTPPSQVAPYSSRTARIHNRDFLMEMERLSISHPRMGAAQMDQKAWRVLFQVLWEDLQHLDLTQLRAGIGRYRRNPENRFFPTSGQLLEACKSPFDTASPAHSKPAFKDDLPPVTHLKDAIAMIEAARAKYKFPRASKDEIERLKEEILARPPIAYVPMPEGRAIELLSALKKTCEMWDRKIEPECAEILAKAGAAG